MYIENLNNRILSRLENALKIFSTYADKFSGIEQRVKNYVDTKVEAASKDIKEFIQTVNIDPWGTY